jgi:hypothetical protein
MVDVAISTGGEVEVISAGQVTGAVEVIVARARQANAATSFGWVSAGPGNIEVGLT